MKNEEKQYESMAQTIHNNNYATTINYDSLIIYQKEYVAFDNLPPVIRIKIQ